MFRKWIEQLFGKKRRNESVDLPVGHAVKQKWQEPTDVLQFVFTVDEQNTLGCEECYELLDHYVDMLASGVDADDVLPHVRQHIEACPCCAEELEALVTIVQHA